MRTALRITVILFVLWVAPGPLPAPGITPEPEPERPELRKAPAFQAGELLNYEVSWSGILTAGEASLGVLRDDLPDGTPGFRFILTGHSTGAVEALVGVDSMVESVFDPGAMRSLSFTMVQKVRKKMRRLSLVFDPDQKNVVSRLNQDPPVTSPTPDPVLDLLSSVYVLRMIDRFEAGTVIKMNVYYSDKNWSAEVRMLGRERIKTPAGEFPTIRLKTISSSNDVSARGGEALVWLTDDARRIPVLAKSTIKVGSFVFTLTGFSGVR